MKKELEKIYFSNAKGTLKRYIDVIEKEMCNVGNDKRYFDWLEDIRDTLLEFAQKLAKMERFEQSFIGLTVHYIRALVIAQHYLENSED